MHTSSIFVCCPISPLMKTMIWSEFTQLGLKITQFYLSWSNQLAGTCNTRPNTTSCNLLPFRLICVKFGSVAHYTNMGQYWLYNQVFNQWQNTNSSLLLKISTLFSKQTQAGSVQVETYYNWRSGGLVKRRESELAKQQLEQANMFIVLTGHFSEPVQLNSSVAMKVLK